MKSNKTILHRISHTNKEPSKTKYNKTLKIRPISKEEDIVKKLHLSKKIENKVQINKKNNSKTINTQKKQEFYSNKTFFKKKNNFNF